jgi:hypothetical protein
MAKQDPVPAAQDKFVVWHDNLTACASSPDGSTVGVTAGEKTTLAGDNATLHTGLTGVTTTRAVAKQATATMQGIMATADANARGIIGRIKKNANYTVALGDKFQIEGPEDSTTLADSQPPIKGRWTAQGALLEFVKGKSQGVKFLSHRDGDAGFVFLATDTESPYVDNRPLLVAGKPEQRQYKAIYLLHDQETGNWSDIITVVCTG